ncbi:ABC transporter permease [Micromonospora sp. NBC_01796]|uniref:ABC transporter permease n=1 Tax=Micromonospora sp. NBC_01796 TaxID=2975987 RepID=UPI002DDAE767|nr:ABC transporter permease [Micromonospora sp. NBC_01796]WSA83834.1 ABC transporter permease [Micromonospora sp. NBC_01796]
MLSRKRGRSDTPDVGDTFIEPSRLALRDLFAETLAGVLQRPGRTFLTASGTVLGVASLIAILGLTTTASAQIGARFNALVATEVVVEDTGGEEGVSAPMSFPADSGDLVESLNGVRHAGVMWSLPEQFEVTATPMLGAATVNSVDVVALSPGALQATHPRLSKGRIYEKFHNQRAERVVVLGAVAARRLGVSRLDAQPAVFIDGTAFTVLGIIDEADRHSDLLFAAMVPVVTAQKLWGDPHTDQRASMWIDTQLGAASLIGRQVALALRPDAPGLFKVLPPADPRELRNDVAGDLNVLFLVLAVVCLLVGAFGIANTTLVSVLERVAEIGLRRALGGRRRHIAAQFLAESGVVGTFGGLLGATIGIVVVVATALIREWTPVVDPWLLLGGPVTGLVIGILAGVYPAIRAMRFEPVEALRR